MDRHGNPTEQYVRLQRQRMRLIGIKSAVRIRAELVTSMSFAPDAKLIGTYKNGGQKMVDHMLALDAIHLGNLNNYDSLLLITNDDDFVPAIIALSRNNDIPIRWLRKRQNGMNDHLFVNSKVIFLCDQSWSDQNG